MATTHATASFVSGELLGTEARAFRNPPRVAPRRRPAAAAESRLPVTFPVARAARLLKALTSLARGRSFEICVIRSASACLLTVDSVVLQTREDSDWAHFIYRFISIHIFLPKPNIICDIFGSSYCQSYSEERFCRG